jgi:nucleotide-binding universal stress UspA family protein
MLKSILLVPTVELDIAAGYRVAVDLAQRFGAACDDLYVSIASQTETVSAMAGEGGLGWYVADLQEREEAWRKAVTAIIDRARNDAGIKGRSLAPDGTLAGAMALQGAAHDLIVVDAPRSGGMIGALEGLRSAIFESTRPVLVVPPEGRAPREHAFLVLGDSVPAIRALHGALPLIEGIPRISVLVNCHETWRDLALELLSRHGHRPEIVKTDKWTSARDRGRVVLRTANKVGADVIVMGAFAAGRLARLVGMGGATEKVVTGSNVPVLLVH